MDQKVRLYAKDTGLDVLRSNGFMSFRTITICAGLLLFFAGSSAAQAVKLEFQDGKVNLIAQNVPVRVILAEWARLGGTRIINGDRVAGTPVTLELRGVAERQALDIVLRGVAGYMIAARDVAGAGASRFDRIMILPTSTAPRPTATPATFAPPPPQAPRPQPIVEEGPEQEPPFDDDPAENPIGVTGRGRAVSVGPVNGAGGGRATGAGGQPLPSPLPVAQPPAPRPAPGTPTTPANPFTTLPGSARPGEITPVPQPQQPGTAQPNTNDR